MHEQVIELLSAKKGHFLLESGHHGDLWLQLESLFLSPQRVQPLVAELAAPLSNQQVDIVCGPLVEGAFVALLLAPLINAQFVYSERYAHSSGSGLFPAGYRVPSPVRAMLRGKRVAIVSDVINAGSAMRGTFADLQDCGATVIGISALLVLGTAAFEFALSRGVPLRSVTTLSNNVWIPAECPHCAAGTTLEDPGCFAATLPTKAKL